MVKGTLGIIGCPILEDEIIHSLSNDADDKTVYVIDTPASGTLKRKLRNKGILFSEADEWEFDNGFTDIDGDRFNVVVMMNKLGLHSRPEVLRNTIEEQLMKYQNRVDAVAVYYGMCGNAGWDVGRWASDKLTIPVFVFRDSNEEVCDDCIGVAVGGHLKYYEFVKKHPGMLYVTPAIAGNWDEFSGELNFTKGFEIMDIHTVKEVFQLFGYRNAVKIDTGIGIGKEEFETGCRNVADITGLEFISPKFDCVDIYPTERIYSEAKGVLKG